MNHEMLQDLRAHVYILFNGLSARGWAFELPSGLPSLYFREIVTSSISLIIGEANCRELGTASCASASSGCKACGVVIVKRKFKESLGGGVGPTRQSTESFKRV